MKRAIKFLLFVCVFASFSAGLFAQASTTAAALATIVTPITITRTADMNFGNVAASAALGTVVLDPATGNRSATGGVTLPATAGTVTRATFTVGGTAAYTYTVTLPAGATTIGNGAGNTMTVNTWSNSPSGAALVIGGGGTQTLYVGATLNVAANQAAGSYSSAVASGGSGDFTVTVNYN